MQPLSTTTITRSFQWGIVIVSDPEGEIPDVDPDAATTAASGALVALVRHEADVPSFDDDFELAMVEITVRLLAEEADLGDRRALFDGALDTPAGTLSVGDANDEVLVSTHHGRTRVVVSVPGDWPMDDHHHESLQIDLVPVTAS